MSSSDPAFCVKEAERIIGYSFSNPRLLEEALTHPSISSGAISYQRLEFVGDAALSMAITKYLYLSSQQDIKPKLLTKLRSANVSNERLARIAVRHGIYPLVRRNSPQLDKQVRPMGYLYLQLDCVINYVLYCIQHDEVQICMHADRQSCVYSRLGRILIEF
jgi:Ribonuclease III domain